MVNYTDKNKKSFYLPSGNVDVVSYSLEIQKVGWI